MARLRFLAPALVAAGIAALSAAPALAQTKWNLPSAYPADNFHTENIAQFAKDVDTLSGGKLLITLHPNAVLFKAPEIKRAVATGQAQAGEVIMSIHENEDPIFGIDVVPFLATSYESAKKLWAASRPFVEKKMEAQGLMVLYAVPWPPQGIFSKTPVTKVEDLKGAK
ncbi:MAG: C4-dicarboxylate ABC transporter substrate-binding protein, partial [Azorhizobium sp. 35-67-15]